MRTFTGLDDLAQFAGQTLGPGEPFVVEQQRIAAFADATDDHQWIHLDEQRAAAGPFGARVAHGYLTLSLLPVLVSGLYSVAGVGMMVNYGLNRVRFPSPLISGSTIRACATLSGVELISVGLQIVMTVTITADGAKKPCCVAETVSRIYEART